MISLIFADDYTHSYLQVGTISGWSLILTNIFSGYKLIHIFRTCRHSLMAIPAHRRSLAPCLYTRFHSHWSPANAQHLCQFTPTSTYHVPTRTSSHLPTVTRTDSNLLSLTFIHTHASRHSFLSIPMFTQTPQH